jgi:hypothetical protein
MKAEKYDKKTEKLYSTTKSLQKDKKLSDALR